MKSAFITGGAGFIGSRLARSLASQGYRVTLYDNFSTGTRKHVALVPRARRTVIRGDVRQAKKLQQAMEKCEPDVVFHLAALHYIPDCVRYPAKTRQINVTGTRLVLEAARRLARKPYVVFASTAAVYKNSSKPFSERSTIGPIDAYGESKVKGEQLMHTYGRAYGLPFSVLRFFNVYGPNDTVPHVIPRIVSQLHRGPELVLGNLEPRRDFIYIDDLVAGILAAYRARPSAGVYNLGTGKEYSIKSVVRTVRSLTSPRLDVSVHTDPVLMRRSDRMHLVADNRKARRELRWKPRVSMREGLAKILRAENI